MKKFLIKKRREIIFSVAAVAAMWLAWVIAYFSVKNEYIIPSFTETVKSLFALLDGKSFWKAFSVTFLRTVESFIISFALAAFFAGLSACSKSFKAFFKPVVGFFRTLPTLAIILILLIWTTPKSAPVIVTALVLFPMIYAQIISSVEGIDGELLEMAKVYSIKDKEKLFKIYLPLVSPSVLSQSGANVSLGIKIMISAEVLSNTYGSMGGLMQNARLYVDMPRLAALTIVAVAAGILLEITLSQLVRLNYKWSKKEKSDD